MHVIAAKAVAFFEAMDDSFKEYSAQIIANAKALASALSDKGFTLVSGGTDNHLMLVDVRSKNLTGKQAESILDAVGVTVNKNTIPFDPASPFVTSGIRIGTPAVTTRGMTEEAMRTIGEIISLSLSYPDDADVQKQAAVMVTQLCRKYRLYR